MSEIVIDYVRIIQAIGEQLNVVWHALKEANNEEIANVKKIEVSDEQSFNKKKGESKIEKGSIYIVVRFGSGSINCGSSVTPVSLYVLGTSNKVKPTQLLLSVFASSWTTKNLAQDLDGEISNALQVWNTPEIITNFNDIDADFRNLFRLSGNIVAGPSAVRLGTLTYYYEEYDEEEQEMVEKSEIVNVMSFQDGYRASLDSQPFGNTFGFATSEVNFSTYTFSISTYLLDNHISAHMLAIRGFRNTGGVGIVSTASQNDWVKIKLEFTNGFTNIGTGIDDIFGKFKVVDSQISQEIANISGLTISFSR